MSFNCEGISVKSAGLAPGGSNTFTLKSSPAIFFTKVSSGKILTVTTGLSFSSLLLLFELQETSRNTATAKKRRIIFIIHKTLKLTGFLNQCQCKQKFA